MALVRLVNGKWEDKYGKLPGDVPCQVPEWRPKNRGSTEKPEVRQNPTVAGIPLLWIGGTVAGAVVLYWLLSPPSVPVPGYGTPIPASGEGEPGGTAPGPAPSRPRTAVRGFAFHLRSTATAATSGRAFPAGTRVELLEATRITRNAGRELLWKVRVPSGEEGWTFVTHTEALAAV